MNMSAVSAIGRKPLKERSRRPEEALTHSVNHWIRVEALAILAEGEFSAGEVAEMVGEDVKNVRGHLRDLYDSGCIEFAGYKMVGSVMRPVYRAIVLPVVYDETYSKMSIKDRHDLNGAVVQGILAETVSSYRNQKMDTDEELCLLWDALNLDAEGKREILALLTTTWTRAQRINGKAANRMAKSGATGETTFLGLLGFKRGRPGRPEGGYHGLRKK
jgi:DNA-binding transcriptional ArsR family regulator